MPGVGTNAGEIVEIIVLEKWVQIWIRKGYRNIRKSVDIHGFFILIQYYD